MTPRWQQGAKKNLKPYLWAGTKLTSGKESAYNARAAGSIPGLGRSSGGGHGNPLQYSFFCFLPTPVFLPEESQGQKSLVGYSP